MRRSIARLVAAHAVALAACALAAAPLSAGQVRVTLVSNTFSPATISANPGDHVVWVWQGGPGSSHTVTSGTDGTIDGDERFHSGFLSGSLAAYSWKSALPGPVDYFCEPHFNIGMTGVINLGSGVAVSDFRITEVQFNAASGLDLIEITNFGAAAGDLGRYRFAIPADTATVPLQSFVVPAGARVVVHANANGAQAAPTNLYLPTLVELPATGSLALYAPNTATDGSGALTRADQMIDFVQWGAPGQDNEATAAAAAFWTAGQAVLAGAGSGFGAGHSLEFCGSATQRGASHWAEVSTPNFGADGGCTTPTLRTTWGRIKSLYR